MEDKPWDVADMAIVASKLQVYTLQFLLMKGLASTEEVQNLVDQYLANIRRGAGFEGALAYSKMILADIPGITVS